jgi:hypothetical protein
LPEFRDSYFKNNLPFIFFNMPTSLLRTFVWNFCLGSLEPFLIVSVFFSCCLCVD